MGCRSSKEIKGMSPIRIRNNENRHSTNVVGTHSNLSEIPGSLGDVESLKDFNVVYTDFIGERSGKITDHYTILSPPVGKGSFGEVRRAIHTKTNIVRAVKIIYKNATNKKEQETLINEVNVLKTLDHPNIIKIYEFYQDEKQFYIVSDHCSGGELFDKIASLRSFSEKRAATTLKQILSAVSYCHAHHIVHRDLKPENILYESKQADALIKVIDFGTSKFYDPQTQMNQKFGTPYYVAPEVLKRRYTEKCDIWSCGVILYVLLCGRPPFNGETDKEILNKVAVGSYNFKASEWGGVSQQAKDFVKRLMEIDPAKRYSAEEALCDPWFKSVLGDTTSFDRPLAVSTLTNLKHFRANQKLQYATWMFLVSYLTSSEERTNLLKIFQALDTNQDGQLSREELIIGYRTLLDSPDPEGDVNAIMEAVDNNHSGAIDYTEFVIATINRQKMLKKEKLEAAFRLMDKDGDGYLTTDELEEIFNPGKHKQIDHNVWIDLIKEFDQNGDGKISMKEFKDMMRKLM